MPIPTPKERHRRSIRLKGYDYHQPGAYFITICTKDRICLFGEVVGGEMRLNEMGRLVAFTWFDLPNHIDGVVLDAFVVMPNHVHGIITIVGAGSEPAPTMGDSEPAPTMGGRAWSGDAASAQPIAVLSEVGNKRQGLPEIVRPFKTFSARRINAYRQTPGLAVWQRNYFEHIIRNDVAWQRIREYIAANPRHWNMDRDNPAMAGNGSPPPRGWEE